MISMKLWGGGGEQYIALPHITSNRLLFKHISQIHLSNFAFIIFQKYFFNHQNHTFLFNPNHLKKFCSKPDKVSSMSTSSTSLPRTPEEEDT